MTTPMTNTPSPTDEDRELIESLTRPIIGIENRAAQEVFDIMCDRIRNNRRLSDRAKLEEALASIWVAIPLGPHDAVSTWRSLAIACQNVAHTALNRSTDRGDPS